MKQPSGAHEQGVRAQFQVELPEAFFVRLEDARGGYDAAAAACLRLPDRLVRV